MINQSQRSENITQSAPEAQRSVRLRLMPGIRTPSWPSLPVAPEFKPVEITVAEEVIGCFLKERCSSGYRVWVAVEETDKVIGYVCFGQTPLTEGTWDVYWIAVAGAWRGRGVGRLLLQHAEGEIRDGGGRMILIETSSKPEYQKAMLLYGRMGYLPVSIITDFYAPGDSKLTLQKLIGATDGVKSLFLTFGATDGVKSLFLTFEGIDHLMH